MEPVRVVALPSLEAALPHQAEMEALNRSARRPCPFSTLAFLRTLVAHDEYARADQAPLVLLAFEGQRLLGYLPLRRERDALLGLPFGRITVLASHDTDRPHVVARPEDEARCSAAFYAHLLEAERGWAALELPMQDADSSLQVLPRLPAGRFLVRRVETMPNTTVPLEGVTFPEYFKGLAHGQRANLGRLGRRLLASGQVEVLACADPRARRPLLDLYLDLERRSWKHAAKAGIGRSPQRVALFQSLCEEHQPLTLGVDLVLLDDLPIAGLVSGTFQGGLYGLEMAFDSDHDDLAPGHLVALMAIRRAIEHGLRFLNLKSNYSYYKEGLGGLTTPTTAIKIFRVGTVPWLRALGGSLRHRLSPPVAPAGRFNPDRRRVRVAPAAPPPAALALPARVRPARSSERERAKKALHDLEDLGVDLGRLSGAALEHALPFAVARDAAAREDRPGRCPSPRGDGRARARGAHAR